MFEDRRNAGERLGAALGKYKNKGVYVLGIPKGGVCVGFEVAKQLKAKFSILISRKLPLPQEPEAGFGAIAEDGSAVIQENIHSWLSQDTIDEIMQRQRQEITRRIKVLRQNRPLPDIQDKIVILVDDGLAMGYTMQAAILLCRKKHAQKIIVAVPVAGEEVAKAMTKLADEVVVLESPKYFRAVAQVYKNWYDVPDEEVIAIMKEWHKKYEPD